MNPQVLVASGDPLSGVLGVWVTEARGVWSQVRGVSSVWFCLFFFFFKLVPYCPPVLINEELASKERERLTC